MSQDADGNIWFRTPNRTVIKVAIDGEVSIDGRVLINCRESPGGEVDLDAGEVECYGGYIEAEDRFGNELEVYPTIAEAEAADGSEYSLPLVRSPVQVRVSLSGGEVKVETAVETVTVGAGGETRVTTAGEEVIVDGDDYRIRAGGLEVSGDWRGAGTRYGSADTDRVLVELGATRQGDLIQLALSGDILFDFDSTAIQPDAGEQLAKAAHVIRQRSVGEVYVVGHTDSVGQDAYNQKLSQERAVAVMGWLSRHEGIPASVMVGRGLGSSKPVAHNTMPDGSDDPAGRARNRRVEILLATREGVDLVDVAGLVRVSGQGVEVAGGAVRVDEGGVRVGGVEVTSDGVKVGGVTVGTGGASAGGARARVVGDDVPAFCKSGETCNLSCPHGDCTLICEDGARCDFSCSGGDCAMRCAPSASCDFSCTGGDCIFDCRAGSDCRTSCTGRGCIRP